MKRHAKASSAGSTQRQATGLGRVFRGALATRGASSDADGSGAPSHRRNLAVLALALAAFVLLALAPLSQAKVLVNGFGASAFDGQGSLGGEFVVFGDTVFPRGIAVNTSGNGAPAGTSYVVDRRGNRVERFGPTGAFQRLWGEDVIATSVNERQRLIVNANAGTYTLSFDGFTTDAIAFDADPNAIREALAALPSVSGSANVYVSQGAEFRHVFIVTFEGAFAAADQPQLSADTGQLTGDVAISTIVNGHVPAGGVGTGFEICTAAADCKEGSASSTTANGGQLNNAQGVAVNQSNGHVYVTDGGQPTDGGNRRVDEFDADGNFVRAWGWDVVETGGAGDVSTNAFEICTVASDCKQGLSGANGGEFGSEVGYPVTDSSNNVWVPDTSNRRIQEFDSSGNFIAAYGYNVNKGGALEKCTSTTAGTCEAGTQGSLAGQFSNLNPSRLALDSSGNVYAIDSGNNRVQKFNPALTTASDFGASTFPTYTTSAPQEMTSSQGGTRLDFAVKNDVSGGGETEIVELDPSDASVKDTSLVGGGFFNRFFLGGISVYANAIVGLAAYDATGALYASTPSYASPGRKVLVFGAPLPAPVLTINPVTVKTDTSAELSATIDPKGGLVGCKFQYSTDQLNWTDVAEPDCETLANSGSQPLGEHVTGLNPNTHYFFRLQVSRPLVANSTTSSAVKTFDTDSVPPVISDVGAIQVADTSARMVGTINPRNSTTGYVFEYGTTPALGHSTEPLDIGGGTTPIAVSQVVGGLAKDTTYYFKLVASNAFGSSSSDQKTLHTRTIPFPPANPGSCPNEAVRIEQGTTFLPDCRAYEMVSPPEKNQGSAVQGGFGTAGFAVDGNAAGFCTTALFGDPPPQMTSTCASYVTQRTATGPTGWQTSSPFPRFCRNDRENSANGGAAEYALSPNFDHAVINQPETADCPFGQPLIPGAPLPARNVYREDFSTDPPAYDLLAPNPNDSPVQSAESDTVVVEGASADFSHIVYRAITAQSPEPAPPAPSFKVYDWHEGSISLVSKGTDGEPLPGGSEPPAWHEASSGNPMASAVSENGDRIFFDNPVPAGPTGGKLEPAGCRTVGCNIYMRENDTTTYAVSASECTVNCTASHSPAQFAWANKAGDVALFFSCDRLTDESTPFDTGPSSACENAKFVDETAGAGEQAKLYRWVENAAPGHHLVDLTVDHEPADGTRPRAKSVIGMSEDGETVYFVTHGQIVPGAPADEGLKLYRWRYNGGAPTVDYIGPYVSTWSNGQVNDPRGELEFDPNVVESDHAHVTPDGRYMMIDSKLAYDPAADRDSDIDLYRWDEADGWTCISCQLPGVPSVGGSDSHAFLGEFRPSAFVAQTLNYYGERDVSLSPDGKRIVFSTPDALVPGDVNGEAGCQAKPVGSTLENYTCEDVYEWNDGTLSLLTPGTESGQGGKDPYRPMGTTAKGDAFFLTSQRLVGFDNDNATDIYTARINGGFPEPPAQPPTCEGESCRGEGTLAANGVGAGTAVFQGPGNPAPKHRKAGKPRKHKKHHKRASHKRANHNRRAGR